MLHPSREHITIPVSLFNLMAACFYGTGPRHYDILSAGGDGGRPSDVPAGSPGDPAGTFEFLSETPTTLPESRFKPVGLAARRAAAAVAKQSEE